MPVKVFLNVRAGPGPGRALQLRRSRLPCSAFEPYRKINWQTVGVGFRTAAQVADGIARPAWLINDSGVLR